METEIKLRINGERYSLRVDTRTTLLDALREGLGVTSTKKGCDHGQCGSCTVLLDGRRTLSCLTLAVTTDDTEIVTAEGLGGDNEPHPLHRAFIDNDAFQCGYCTPGQICSAAGMLTELDAGHPSAATPQGSEPRLDDDEIRERMSGNLCRCGAYSHIVSAIREVGGRA
ncbi:(2Fe-2S)-binding protein [Nocardiopsis ansamitocini]|uniref:Aldehyde dehydrogenase iron-sulfur subunit n=1 Tax=Nocardiopsis ansamitocini TaxID=1670832 RepID=A0A9W6UGY4_9ACTN|nr:2Fe-2S iron-sulfur cluster-binding protein [Nocardiopsis ansamitocini]GLU48241.1 aldehyde dehydrogenase iron-sulfur subunit [Nocardiopsis ansamitocini]